MQRCKIYNSLNYIKINHKFLDLFIYCAYISNKCGVENFEYDSEYKKKKARKYHTFFDKNKNIVNITSYKNSTIYDIKTVKNTLKNIIIDTSNKKINVIGDINNMLINIFFYIIIIN